MRSSLLLPLLLLTLVLFSTPKKSFQKLGLLLRYEKGNMKQLKQYIEHFSDPFCEAIEEYNIIVTAKGEQQFRMVLSSLEQISSTIPINYHVSGLRQTNMQYKLPKNSKAELFYTSSIFVSDQQCQDLKDYIELANLKSQDGVFGPIGESESSKTIQVDLRRDEDQIFYYDKVEGDHYSFVQDIRLIPRHLIQLSYSQIKEVAEMRNIVNSFCQELFLNFISAHFYPELKPFAFNFPTSINSPIQEGEEFQQKSVCLRQMIKILGYVPVYNQRRGYEKSVWVNPNTEKVIELKKQQLIKEINKPKKTTRMLEEQATLLFLEQRSKKQSISGSFQDYILNVLMVIAMILASILTAMTLHTNFLERRLRKCADSQ